MCLLVPSLIPEGDDAASLYTRANAPTGKVKQPFSNPLITRRLSIYHSSAGFVFARVCAWRLGLERRMAKQPIAAGAHFREKARLWLS